MRWRIVGAGVMAVAAAGSPAPAQCGWSWTQGATLPSGRTDAAMVYDSARQRCVLVGGTLSGGEVSNATIEYDGAAWQLKTPAGSLPRRTQHAMAFDASRGVVVLFGGLTAPPEALSSTTYEYDGTAWRIIHPPASPSPRRGHAMAYDPQRQVVVLQGGVTSTGVASDTWEYNGSTWTLRAFSAPGPRCEHSMAFDPVRQQVVLFGGASSLTPLVYSTQTHVWNGSVWTPVPGTSPAGRTGGMMASSSSHVVLAGGADGPFFLTTTWVLGPQGWSAEPMGGTPPARTGGSMAYHAGLGKFVAAAGAGSGGNLMDAWLLNAGVSFVEVPGPQQAVQGADVTLSASVSGAASAWQWRRGGAPLSNGGRVTGATGSALTIHGVTPDDQGVYEVVVTTACGTMTSPGALLSVVPACGSADFNGDGDVGTDQDIEAFFFCLGGNCCPTCWAGGADFNGDGDVGTDQDIESYFRVLGGGAC